MKKIFITLALLIVTQFLFSQITFDGFIQDTLIPYQKTGSGDIDNNGTDDLVIGTIEWDSSDFFPPETKRNIEIYLQSETGTFVLNQIFRYEGRHDIQTIDLVDLDNDDWKELILGYSNKVVIYKQDRLHQFSKVSEHLVYSNVKTVSFADINNDSLCDMLVSDVAAQEFTILYQNKSGDFDHHKITPDINGVLQEPELIDINNDGRIDVIYLTNLFWDAPFYVLLNDSIEGITGQSIGILKEFVDFTFNSYEVGYVNSDNWLDIVATSGGNTLSEGNNKPQVHIFYQREDAMLEFEHKTIDAFDIPSEIKIIDLNGDDINDIVIDHNGWQTLSVYEQAQFGTFSHVTKLWNYAGSYTSDYSWTFGDFNNDCKTDVFIPAAGSLLFYMNTTDFTCQVSTDNDVNSDLNNKEITLHLYPNPVLDQLIVSSPDISVHQAVIEFYNNLGEWVEQKILTEPITSIDVAHFPQGVYTYVIRNNHHMMTNGRIIKL